MTASEQLNTDINQTMERYKKYNQFSIPQFSWKKKFTAITLFVKAF